MEAPLPNFLVIGAGKAGTSSLYFYLKQHPQVFMSEIKETNFFVYDAQNPMDLGQDASKRFQIRSLEAYRALFKEAVAARAIGEASPWYLVDPGAAERIRHHLPGAKLVAILRDPAERAFSAYSMYVRDGLEPRTFARAIADEEHGAWDHALRRAQKHYVSDGYYARHLRVYCDLFERSQIAVYLYEDLQTDALSLMRRLYGFLGVDDSFVPETGRRHNPSGLPRNPLLRPLVHKRSILTTTMRRVLPDRLRPRARAAQNALRDRYAQAAPPLPPESRTMLIKKYREDIIELQDLIRRDLRHWLV